MGNKNIHNINRLRERRKDLRKNLTEAESYLWKIIQHSKLSGRKFRRQHSVGGYVLDFYCPSEKIPIELDGEIHQESDVIEYDNNRTEYLNLLGIKVLRFSNNRIFDDIENVLKEIESNFSA
jgi:very-short-patch-repair endonuclease